MKSVDVIVPVYNEEAGIAQFDGALRRVLDALAGSYEFQIIYVLDRSPDGSHHVLKSLVEKGKNSTLLHLSSRFGHQMSLVAGLDYSEGDAVIMMDSDLQHPPELIPELLKRFEQGYDVVQTLRSYGREISLVKRMTSRSFYWLQNVLSPVELKDGAADFRLVSRRVVRVFQKSIREHNQFLRALFQWVGFRTAYVTFISPPRAAGRTKYTLGRLLAFMADGVVSFSRAPLRAVTLIGFLLSAVSLAYGAFLVSVYFLFGDLPRGYTSLIVVVLFIGGLQLTVTGVVGEYIGHIFDEVKSRPLYIVDEVISSGERPQ